MSDDLISRKEVLERLRLLKKLNTTESIQIAIDAAEQQINNCKTAFDKEKVIEEIKTKYGQSANWKVIFGICKIVEKDGVE